MTSDKLRKFHKSKDRCVVLYCDTLEVAGIITDVNTRYVYVAADKGEYGIPIQHVRDVRKISEHQ